MAIMARVRVSEISVFGDEEGNKKAERVRLAFQDEDTMRVAGKWLSQSGAPLDLQLVSETDWNFFNLGDEYRITIERVRSKRKTLDMDEIDLARKLKMVDVGGTVETCGPSARHTITTAVYPDGTVREFTPTPTEEGNEDAGTEE